MVTLSEMVKIESKEEPHPVLLRTIVPKVPDDPTEKKHLDKDLQQLGCHGLRHVAWNLRGEAMARELLAGLSNEWLNTLRAKPENGQRRFGRQCMDSPWKVRV